MSRHHILSLMLLIASCSHLTALLAQTPIRQMNPDINSGPGATLQSGTFDGGGGRGKVTWGRDTTSTDTETEIPIGQFQWRVDERLGTVIDALNNDTVVHNFQNWNLTDGMTGQYSILGNVGSPRLNRIFLRRPETSNFIFLQPFDHFRTSLSDFLFTNTKSPVTNLAYHKSGNNQNGEDRVRAYFASNINKNSGIGFKIDYLYGRGYYNNQQNSQFGGTVYGYHRGEKYNIHAYVNANHSKIAENGGIENDLYIEDPQSFQSSYTSRDIPVMLSSTWNRNDEQTYYLTHHYNLGFDRLLEVPDSLKPKMPSDADLLGQLSDSIRTILAADSIARLHAVDSLQQVWQSQQVPPTEFIPVTALIHTLHISRMSHEYISKNTPADYYTNHFYGDLSQVADQTDALSLRNTLGIAQLEGFNKWAQMGITLFGSHTLRTYKLPELVADSTRMKMWKENDITVGGQIARRQGKLIHYDAQGEMWLVGEHSGDFKVDGDLDMEIGAGTKDSIRLDVHAHIHHTKPGFYLRHYHSQFAWWDHTSLDRELRTRVEGRLHYARTKTTLNVGFENITNYTYFGMQNTLTGTDSTSTLSGDYSHDVAVRQHNGSVQVFSAMLEQNFKLGPLHWENEVTYQKSSNQHMLPLPQLNVYTNLFLLFRIAKVLRVQLGGDMRYFTSYYAPDYSPAIGQFAVQDQNFGRVKVGNYPLVNVYVNMHLKHCRIYLGMYHVNATEGHYFWAPHYPINPRAFRFGVSWNFFN